MLVNDGKKGWLLYSVSEGNDKVVLRSKLEITLKSNATRVTIKAYWWNIKFKNEN